MDAGMRTTCPYCGAQARRTVRGILKYGTSVLLLQGEWRAAGSVAATWLAAGAILAGAGFVWPEAGRMLRSALGRHGYWLGTVAAVCLGMAAYRHSQRIPVRSARWRIAGWAIYYGFFAVAFVLLVLFARNIESPY